MKYMGGKSKMVKYLKPIIQGLIDKYEIENYIEPFVGGCNVIKNIEAKNRYGYDNNRYVIALYNAIKTGYAPWADGTRENMTREKYLDIKHNKDNYPPELVGVTGTLCAYCGDWFGVVRE